MTGSVIINNNDVASNQSKIAKTQPRKVEVDLHIDYSSIDKALQQIVSYQDSTSFAGQPRETSTGTNDERKIGQYNLENESTIIHNDASQMTRQTTNLKHLSTGLPFQNMSTKHLLEQKTGSINGVKHERQRDSVNMKHLNTSGEDSSIDKIIDQIERQAADKSKYGTNLESNESAL